MPSSWIPSFSISRRLPHRIDFPPRSPWTPKPTTASKLVISTFSICRSRSVQARIIASANGCSDLDSSVAANSSRWVSWWPLLVTMSVTRGYPSVNVPVLSKTTVFIRWITSKIGALLIKIPSSAPRPTPATTAVGVANPSAQGQATIKTDIKKVSALASGSPAKKNQQPNVSTATPITMGTKTLVTWSANVWIGAFDPWADSTSWMICASIVSSPTFCTRKLNLPVPLTVPLITSSPTVL